MTPMVWLRIIMFVLALIAEGMNEEGAVKRAASVFGVSPGEIKSRLW